MSNISYVSSLSNNMKNLTYDGSKINSLNVGYNDFMSNSKNINGLTQLKLNNGNSVFGANLSIPKSESFTSQLDSNLKMSALAGTAMLGAVKGSVVNNYVNLQGEQGTSIGLVPMTVAIAGTLAVLGYQCQNTFDIVGKLISNPLTQAEKDEMILTEDEQVVSIYDANAGNYVLPKSTFGAMSKYIKRVGWLESSGVDTRSGYYGLTKYNVLSVERDYKISSYSGKYVPHQGVNIGTSATIRFAYTYASTGNSYQDDMSVQSSSDIFMDFWTYGSGGYFHVTFYSLNPINNSSRHLMIQNDRIYIYDWNTRIEKDDLLSYTLTNWSGVESANQINFIDMYNQLKGSVNNTRSSIVNSVSNGVNTMAEIDEDARFIINKMTDIGSNAWSNTGDGVTIDFTDYTATSPIYAYLIRYVNTDDYLNKIDLVLCSLDNFTLRTVDSYNNGVEDSYSTRSSSSVSVDGHTFYNMNLGERYVSDGIDCTLALPVYEYDCSGGSIPSNPTDPISNIVKWQLLNSSATPTDIGEGSGGTVEGLDQVGTAIAIGSADTTDDIWTKCVNNLPSTRFKNNALSMFTPIADSIVNQDAVAISLPTTMSETVVSTTGAKANTVATDYTDTGIETDATARAIGANVTGIGVTTKSIDWAGSVADAVTRAMSLTYDVADTEEPSEQELVDLIGTPTVPTPTGEANAMYSVYKLTQAELDSLGGWLWSSNFFTQVEKAWDNPMSNIISLNKVYCDLPTGTSGTVVIGMIDSNVSCEKINTRYASVDFGSVNINEYFGNMLDYLSTDIQIYLPFIGIVRLDNSDIMRGLVKLKYKVDLFTGDLLASISVYRDMVEQTAYQFNGNCAVGYPYSAGSTFGSMISSFGGIASLIGAGLATSGAGVIAGLAGGVAGLASARADVQHSGNLSGSIGVMGSRTPYIIITRPQVVSTDMNKKYVGVANNIVDKISNHTGYIKVTEPQIQTLALKSEVEMIRNELEKGVLV